MKKLICLLGSVLIIFVSLFLPVTVNAQTHTNASINIYSLKNTVSPELLDGFKEKYADENDGAVVDLKNREFPDIEQLLLQIKNTSEKVDLVCVPNQLYKQMIVNDCLMPVSDIKNINTHINSYGDISPFILEKANKLQSDAVSMRPDAASVENNVYGIPFSWETLGVLYNKKKISDTDIYSWNVLFDNENMNRIVMKDSIAENYIAASIMGNYSTKLKKYVNSENYSEILSSVVNDFSSANISIAKDKMLVQRTKISPLFSNNASEQFVSGKQWAGVFWSSEVQPIIENARKNNIELGFYIPEEGSVIRINTFAVPKQSGGNTNISLTREFLEFVNGDIAKTNMAKTGKTSVVSTSDLLGSVEKPDYDSVEADYFFGNVSGSKLNKVNNILYPSKQNIKKCVLYQPMYDDNKALYEMWQDFKVNPFKVIVIVISSVMGALIFVVAIYILYRYFLKPHKSLINDIIESKKEIEHLDSDDDDER